ncbi:MAG: carbohydrate ABC transporter permease [Spirochaetia bacterium]
MKTPLGKTSAKDVAVFLAPSFIGFFIFVLLPCTLSLFFSFAKYSGGRLTSIKFVGLKNYIKAFTNEQFWQSMYVTVQFVIGSVFVVLLISLFFALIVNRQIMGRSFFRGILFLPNMLSVVAISLAFALIFHPLQGPMNNFLLSLGLDPLPWLTSPKTALFTVIIIFIWQNFGYYMLIFLSGLQSINPSYYEAADLEGASPFQQFFRITLPMLSPVMFLAVILAVIRSFNVFGHIYVLTGGQDGGGPAGSTSVIVFDIYKNAFSYFRMGYASAEAVILLLIVLTITLIQYKGQRRWVNYEAI